MQSTKNETCEDQALIPTSTIPWDGNCSFRPLQTDTRLYLTLLQVGTAALQLISSLVLHHHHESHQLHLQASARHPVLSQLVSAHTRLDSSSQLCQAHCGQLVCERQELCTHLSCKRAHFKTARGGSGPGGAGSVHANAGGAKDRELPGTGIEQLWWKVTDAVKSSSLRDQQHPILCPCAIPSAHQHESNFSPLLEQLMYVGSKACRDGIKLSRATIPTWFSSY